MSNKLSRKFNRSNRPKSYKDFDPSSLLMTMTDEFFQPARIYYDVHDHIVLQNIFRKLHCMDFDDEKKRWVWNYTDEARTIRFERPWSAPPKGPNSLVIGSLYLPQENHMYIDVNSFERVAAAVGFFGERLEQKIAEVTHAQIYNKISRAKDGIPNHHTLFEEILSHRPDPEAEIFALIAEAKASGTLEKFREEFLKEQQENSKQKMATIETMKIYYESGEEEDCLETLRSSLRMRTTVAVEHEHGNTDFTIHDVLTKAFNIQ